MSYKQHQNGVAIPKWMLIDERINKMDKNEIIIEILKLEKLICDNMSNQQILNEFWGYFDTDGLVYDGIIDEDGIILDNSFDFTAYYLSSSENCLRDYDIIELKERLEAITNSVGMEYKL